MFVSTIAFVPGTPKVQQIVEAFSQAIETGEWAPGSKLPSVRELGQTLGVSKFTLNEALDRLRGRNLLTSSQGRGYFVAVDSARPASSAWVELLPQDLLSVLRRPLATVYGDLRPGGGYRMILAYDDPVANAGKSGDGHDVVSGRFGGIVPGERLEQLIEFESHDPALAGTMRMVWEIARAEIGTRVAIRAEDVPSGIGAEDHRAGLASSLANLAALVEHTP